MKPNTSKQASIQPNQTRKPNSLTLTPSEVTIAKMVDFYADQKQTNNNPYIMFFAKLEQCAISIYTTKKVLFQGDGAAIEADIWRSVDEQQTSNQSTHKTASPSTQENSQPKKLPTQANRRSTSPANMTLEDQTRAIKSGRFIVHGGSDEVGTGDYFGPVCVCACIVTNEQYEAIHHLGIDDSKAMDDRRIREIAPMLRELLVHSLLVLDNKKYNTIHSQYNMNGIKAMLHNQAYVHLRNKESKLPDLCVVDQFVEPTGYFRHLRYESDVVRSLHFETKAESKYLAVACASVIARHAFLMAMDQLSEAYGMVLPKGAGTVVDAAGKQFVQKHGVTALHQVAKFHFANTKKILGETAQTLF